VQLDYCLLSHFFSVKYRDLFPLQNLATIWTALVTDKTFSTYNLVVSSDVVCISTSIGSLIALSTTTKLAQVWTSTDVKNPYSTSPVGFTSKNDSVGIVCGTKYGVKCIDIADGKLVF